MEKAQAQNQFFNAIGRLALMYSNMEATLREILDILTSKDSVIAGLLTDDIQLERRIRKICQLAEYRLLAHRALLDRCRDLMKRANATREERNDLIHGQWKYNAPSVMKGIIVCVDHRWKQVKNPELTKSGGGHWSSDDKRQYTLTQLGERVDAVKKIVFDLIDFRDQLLNTTLSGETTDFHGRRH
jgi:hypothetical protein